MSNAGRGAALARNSEGWSVDAIARAYVEAAGGDASAALRSAITNALASLAAAEQRASRAERFVSRGFVRGQIGLSD
jgi:hypothetical protein